MDITFQYSTRICAFEQIFTSEFLTSLMINEAFIAAVFLCTYMPQAIQEETIYSGLPASVPLIVDSNKRESASVSL